ncbi:MAG: NADH-quinone oxidoreductase subunit NuoN [Kiloniellales bacterium]|nr:NADH-quinone oxidoreductase subunit NuoN [Kiloniellales bacterium]
MITADLLASLPELWLACAGMALLMVGAFLRRDAATTVMVLSVVAVAVALAIHWVLAPAPGYAYGGLYVNDEFTYFIESLVLIGALLAIVMSIGYAQREGMDRFEFPILMIFATLGMLMMVSSNDLIALYIGLELQSLSLYVLAAFRKDTLKSSEAGLKYFVLGALSSGMLLYGSSLVYGFAGTTNFTELGEILVPTALGGEGVSLGVIFGLVFILAGLAFKVSAVPFHMWTPDVYEGAPTAITAFLATAPKVAAMSLTVWVLMGPFSELVGEWRQIVVFISIASMLLGAFAAINQTNIKRLMAYSSIGHVGYMLVGLAAGSEAGVRGVLFYLAIYLVMNVGTFACILSMRRKDGMVEGIEDLKGLSKTNPYMAAALLFFMFSMAGIPPLAGFFGKLYIFLAAIQEGLYGLATIGVLSSVVAAFYYVRIVKLMYFDEPSEAFERPLGREMTAILVATAVVVAGFAVIVSPVVDIAGTAAAALIVQ